MRWWKLLGMAGLVGVAASGAVVARNARVRTSYSPEEIRTRLHARLAEAETEAETGTEAATDPTTP